jgi:hypothetical protein
MDFAFIRHAARAMIHQWIEHKWQYAPPHKNAPRWLARAAAVLRRKIF